MLCEKNAVSSDSADIQSSFGLNIDFLFVSNMT